MREKGAVLIIDDEPLKPLDLSREGKAGWLITIADTGIGIPEADLPHIFERFYRSDKPRNRSTGGAGIGLSIAAAIIAAHGGSITAESNPAGGTVFRIQYPVSPRLGDGTGVAGFSK